jgi:hypothetical protein
MVNPSSSERRCTGFGDGLVLFSHAAADSDSAYYVAASLQWDAARENHHAPSPANSLVEISKARAVHALLIEMSMLPIQALSMRT